MNFSEPGSATATRSSTINSTTPLHFARSLASTLASPTTISDFTKNLTAIRSAAYLLLLPQTCRAEVDFYQAETVRIATGPLGDAILQASTLFFLVSFGQRTAADNLELAHRNYEDIYEATDRMLSDLAQEQERYLDNMTLLLADMKEKWKDELTETGSWHHTAITMGESGIASASALSTLVGARRIPPRNRRYLSDIARHWRTWNSTRTSDSKTYEEVWSYVSGRPLVQE